MLPYITLNTCYDKENTIASVNKFTPCYPPMRWSLKLSPSRSATSIPNACCCASSAAREARTATRCCRRRCSNFCVPGGARAAAQPAVAGRLAVSRPQPGRAAVGPPALPRCPRRRPGRRDQQARLAAHVAAQFRHTPSRARCRYSRDPDACRPPIPDRPLAEGRHPKPYPKKAALCACTIELGRTTRGSSGRVSGSYLTVSAKSQEFSDPRIGVAIRG